MLYVRFTTVSKEGNRGYIIIPFNGGDVVPFILQQLRQYIKGKVEIIAVDVESIKACIPWTFGMVGCTSELFDMINTYNQMGEIYYDK